MRDIPTSPRIIEIKHNRRVRRIRLSILFFILFISFTWALSYFSYDRHIVINEVAITGNHIIDQDDIKAQIFKDISGKYIYLFSQSDSFIFPKIYIYNDLLLSFPRIKNLSVYKDNLKTIHVDISERTGSFLYCGANIPENKNDIGENCYFINNDGFIFDKAPYFSGNVYFKYYLPLSEGTSNPLGKQMLSIEQFHRVVRFIDGITNLGFKPIYITIDQDGTDTLYLESGSNNTAPVINFKNNDDLDIVQDNLSLAMKKPEFADEINSKYNTLLYIDLRFKNKVLYKFQ